MDPKQLFEGFDTAQYEAEAAQRWGSSEAFKESARRTKGYSSDDWRRFAAEQGALYADAFALLTAGEPPDSERARAVAERHRSLIDRWFYPCGREMHRDLSTLYQSDARFAANIDRHGAGLSAFLVAAIRAHAELPARRNIESTARPVAPSEAHVALCSRPLRLFHRRSRCSGVRARGLFRRRKGRRRPALERCGRQRCNGARRRRQPHRQRRLRSTAAMCSQS